MSFVLAASYSQVESKAEQGNPCPLARLDDSKWLDPS